MKRLIDWFRKPAIMSKLINTAGMFDGDFVVYKHHKYYVNCQTGVVIRVEQCAYNHIYIFQSFQLVRFRRAHCGCCNTYSKMYISEAQH